MSTYLAVGCTLSFLALLVMILHVVMANIGSLRERVRSLEDYVGQLHEAHDDLRARVGILDSGDSFRAAESDLEAERR